MQIVSMSDKRKTISLSENILPVTDQGKWSLKGSYY